MKQYTEAEVQILMERAFNSAWDSTGEGYNGEYASSFGNGSSAEFMTKKSKDWVEDRDRQINTLILQHEVIRMRLNK